MPLPTVILIAPALPPVDVPEPIEMEPLLPELVVPLLNERRPLEPALPAFMVFTITSFTSVSKESISENLVVI